VYVPLAISERVLPILVLNIIFCIAAIVAVLIMRIRARLAAPLLQATARWKLPPIAELHERFSDRECTTLLFFMNLPIAFSSLRVCTLFIPPSLQFCPAPTTPASRGRRNMSLCCCMVLLVVAVVVVLIVVKPWNSFKRW